MLDSSDWPVEKGNISTWEARPSGIGEARYSTIFSLDGRGRYASCSDFFIYGHSHKATFGQPCAILPNIFNLTQAAGQLKDGFCDVLSTILADHVAVYTATKDATFGKPTPTIKTTLFSVSMYP